MSATFVAKSTAATITGSTAVVVNSPAGTAAGHLLIVHIYGKAPFGGTAAGTITPPDGTWTQRLVSEDFSNGYCEFIFTKTLTGVADATYTFTASGSKNWLAHSLAYSGVPGAVVFTTAGAASFTAPSVSTATTNATVVRFWSSSQVNGLSGGGGTQPATARYIDNFTGVAQSAASDTTQAGTGATGAVVYPGVPSGGGMSSTLAFVEPTAPTVALTSPASAATVPVHSAGQAFAWTVTDPDVGSAQTHYVLRRTRTSDGAVTYWNGSSFVSGETWVASSTQGVTIPAGTWPVGAYTWAVKVRDNDGLESAYTADRAVTSNTTPNAPALSSPATGATIDRNNTQRFTWAFSDPDAGDTQSGYELRYRIGAGAWTTLTGATPNQYRDIASGTFSADSYEWQVRTQDSLGTFGSWSASGFFTAADPPTGPTITTPTSGSTVTNATQTVSWSTATQEAYQVRTVADLAGSPDTATVYQDTGTVVDASTRSISETFAVTGRYEHVQVREQVAGLWSSWASVRVYVSYTPPPTPTLVATGDDSTASITVTVTNPAPAGAEPALAYNDLHRRVVGNSNSVRIATAIAGGGTFTDYSPASGVAYEYQAVAVGVTGSVASSAWTA